METLASLFGMLLCFILPILLIFLIAYLASKSREKKQNALLEKVPSNADFISLLSF